MHKRETSNETLPFYMFAEMVNILTWWLNIITSIFRKIILERLLCLYRFKIIWENQMRYKNFWAYSQGNNKGAECAPVLWQSLLNDLVGLWRHRWWSCGHASVWIVVLNVCIRCHGYTHWQSVWSLIGAGWCFKPTYSTISRWLSVLISLIGFKVHRWNWFVVFPTKVS